MLIVIPYLLLLLTLAINWQCVSKHYNVKWNGNRWVVRDSKGHFVRITRNPWDILSLI